MGTASHFFAYMKKILIIFFLAFLVFLAFISKPDDKTCIIRAVEYVWGDKTPDKYQYPQYFEQFMNLTSKSVEVNDWFLCKRIRYKYGQEWKTVGIGLFKKVLIL